MLSREVMGGLALAILWVNTLLIAAAVLKRAFELARLGNSFGEILRGKVVQGDGESGAIAEVVIEQVGRLAAGEEPSILFHDRSHACRIFGGKVAVEAGVDVEVASTGGVEDGVAVEGGGGGAVRAEVWVDERTVAAAARCPSDAAFEEAAVDAKKARGFSRTVRVPLAEGREVFVGAGLVSTIAPRTWIAKRVSAAYLFVVFEVLVAALCTAAALHEPVFGTISTAGAAAGFAFFLLVQPIGTAVRDLLRPPSRALRKDTWVRARRPESAPSHEASGQPS